MIKNSERNFMNRTALREINVPTFKSTI